jgi:hypothetical protein
MDLTDKAKEAMRGASLLRMVLRLTILSLGVSVTLAVAFPTPSEQVRSLIETCSTTWKMGFGALLGMLMTARQATAEGNASAQAAELSGKEADGAKKI